MTISEWLITGLTFDNPQKCRADKIPDRRVFVQFFLKCRFYSSVRVRLSPPLWLGYREEVCYGVSPQTSRDGARSRVLSRSASDANGRPSAIVILPYVTPSTALKQTAGSVDQLRPVASSVVAPSPSPHAFSSSVTISHIL